MSGVSTYPGQLEEHLHAHGNTDAGQEHTETLRTQIQYTHTHSKAIDQHACTNMKLVLKFASTPAAHTLGFTHTVSV